MLYCKRYIIENMLGELDDWRRVHTRHDGGAHSFTLAAIVVFQI